MSIHESQPLIDPEDSPSKPDKPEPEVDPDSPLDPPEDTGESTRITRWIRLDGTSSRPYENPGSGEPAKPLPQPVSNSIWRIRYQLYHPRQWGLQYL